MSSPVRVCTSETDLGTASRLMLDGHCGALPIVDHFGKRQLIGMITDRDICLAVGRLSRPAAEILVWEAATHTAHTCEPDDELDYALRIMETYKVHRLPVVTSNGTLCGVLSLDDVVALAPSDHTGPPPHQIMRAMKAISIHRRLLLK